MAGMIHKYRNIITLAAGILIIIAFILNLFEINRIRNLALVTATFIAGLPVLIKALQAIRMRVFSIELLVTIAVIGALAIEEYMESAAVTFLFLFGAALEARTLEKTRSSLKELMDLAPQEAVVLRNGKQVTIAAGDVMKGDRVIIRSGGKVPVDGRVVSGQALLNEAAVTGEPVPVWKKVNDPVFSGTVADSGYIEMEAERVGDETTFARIIELVEEAQETKSKTEKFFDQFSRIYTPAVVLLSIFVYLITRNLHLAITFLVIACPGALVIGAPISNVAGIGNGAKNGILIKGGEVMDRLAQVDTLVFDKTGTLTKGKPEVTAIKTFNRFDATELLRLVAQAETISEHHLGQAIAREAKRRKLDLSNKPEKGEIIKGQGILANISGHRLVIGNRKFLEAEQISMTEEITQYAISEEKAGNSAIFAAVDGRVAGVISIADQIREDAVRVLPELRKNGIRKIIMLTGDNKYTAALAANRLGLDGYRAEMLPEDKVQYINKLKEEGNVVAMAGDGINDAPAIATADLGVAMGQSGTDISMETADVVLMGDKLAQLSHAYSLAQATVRNMKQNTFFAVSIVAVLLIGVLAGSVHLASGMFIHEASILLVILNAMRLIRFNHKSHRKNNWQVHHAPSE
ncbi:MAG: cation-translocating P-type ATPase [Thermoactinomyces sp.]